MSDKNNPAVDQDKAAPKNLLEALDDIARLTQERNALRVENDGLRQWMDKDRQTISTYRAAQATLSAENLRIPALKARNAKLTRLLGSLYQQASEVLDDLPASLAAEIESTLEAE